MKSVGSLGNFYPRKPRKINQPADFIDNELDGQVHPAFDSRSIHFVAEHDRYEAKNSIPEVVITPYVILRDFSIYLS